MNSFIWKHYITIYKHHVRVRAAYFKATQHMEVFTAKIVRQFDELLLFAVRGDVGHEGQVFNEATRFSFGRVRGTEHSPLGRLQWAGTRYLVMSKEKIPYNLYVILVWVYVSFPFSFTYRKCVECGNVCNWDFFVSIESLSQ